MKLNKKGFTLVELLAVIVILALLIVVVANTALPAMNNAKLKSLSTYTERVMEQAKAYVMANEPNKVCQKTSPCDLKTLMGNDVSDQYSCSLYVTGTSTSGYQVYGTVWDKDKNVAYVGKDKSGKTNVVDVIQSDGDVSTEVKSDTNSALTKPTMN